MIGLNTILADFSVMPSNPGSFPLKMSSFAMNFSFLNARQQLASEIVTVLFERNTRQALYFKNSFVLMKS